MKRLLSVALMILVTLVGVVDFSRAAADQTMQPIITQLKDIQQSLDTISHAVSALQSTTNPTTEVPTLLLGPINAVNLDEAKPIPFTVSDRIALLDFSGSASVNLDEAKPIPFTVSDRLALLDFSGSASVNLDEAKLYYLTDTGFAGGDASTACDSGFHMASLSEIQDTSKLQYAPRRTPANDSPASDQASDQFPEHTGWVQTEDDYLTGLVYNCDVWRSSSDQQSGVTMTRRSLRGENGRSLYESDPAAWWQATRKSSCSQPESVWCVEDPGEHSLTKMSKSSKSTR